MVAFEESCENLGTDYLDLGKPQMFDPRDPAEVNRVYDYMENPVLTTLQ